MKIKNIFIKRKLYYKLFFSFSLFSLLIILSISITTSLYYVKTVSSQLEETYADTLEKLNKDFDTIFSRLSQINANLRHYPEVNTFLVSNLADHMTAIRINPLLISLTASDPYIYSTIIYSKNYNYTFNSGKTGANIGQFINTDLKHPNIHKGLNIVYTTVNQNSTIGLMPLNTISIIYSEPETFSNNFDNAIIFTFDLEEIEKNLLGKYTGINIVCDNSGNVIFKNHNLQIDNSVGYEAYFKNILSSKLNRGSFRTKLSNDTVLITYTKNVSSDFYLINIRSYQTISEIVNKKLLGIILVCILALFVYFILSYVLSNNIYSPIGKATQMFTSYNNENFDEITLISGAFASTIKELQQLKKINTRNSNKLKEEQLKFILKNDILPDKLISELVNYRFNINFEKLILVSLKIDDYQKFDRQLKFTYEVALCKLIPQVLTTSFNCETVNLFDGEVAILLNFKNPNLYDFNFLLSEIEKMQAAIIKTIKVSTTIGIGGIADTIQNCFPAYRKAVQMVKHRFVLGTNRVIYQQYIDSHLSSDIKFSKDNENKLINIIKAGKRQNFIEYIDNIISTIKKCTYRQAVSILFQVITVCIQTINELVSEEKSNYNMGFEEFNDLFSQLQTIYDAKVWMINIFDEYELALAEFTKSKNNKYEELILKTKEYIQQTYDDINLSLEVIAGITEYSPYYFSRIFKDITGMNINDYIKDVRVKKAKHLLQTTDLKASEIGMMVGFSNTSNFYLVFKKEVGVAPATYRQQSKEDS